MLVPGVGAFFFEPLDDVAERLVILELFAAAIAEENDDGHAPEARAGNAPIRPLLDHFVDAVLAPRRNPLHVVNFVERFLPQRFWAVGWHGIHPNEPLLGSAEDYGIVAAPAVRIAVLVRMVPEQRVAIGKQLHDDRIRGENILAFVFGQTFEIDTFAVDWRVNLQAVFLAGVEVVHAVAGSRVNDAAALTGGPVTAHR